ncbi:hypothetical protein O5698_00635 [Escherichia coli]|nr:hypothetical protein [Escherichia coli]
MNLKQLAGAVRRLLNPATGEEDRLKKETLDEIQARPRQAGVRSASPGISIASGLNPGRLAGILRNAADGITRDFFYPCRRDGRTRFALRLGTAHPQADGGGYRAGGGGRQ